MRHYARLGSYSRLRELLQAKISLSSIDKFNYLRTLLEGSAAAAAVAGLTLTSSNYGKTVAVLKKQFGNKQLIISTIDPELFSMGRGVLLQVCLIGCLRDMAAGGLSQPRMAM